MICVLLNLPNTFTSYSLTNAIHSIERKNGVKVFVRLKKTHITKEEVEGAVKEMKIGSCRVVWTEDCWLICVAKVRSNSVTKEGSARFSHGENTTYTYPLRTPKDPISDPERCRLPEGGRVLRQTTQDFRIFKDLLQRLSHFCRKWNLSTCTHALASTHTNTHMHTQKPPNMHSCTHTRTYIRTDRDMFANFVHMQELHRHKLFFICIAQVWWYSWLKRGSKVYALLQKG